MVVKTKEKPVLSERVRRLRQALIEATPVLSVERLRFLKQSYQETEGQSPIMRRARLLEKILNNMTLFIDENPIVGTQTKHMAGVNPFPEYSCDWMKTDADVSSYLGRIELGEEEKAALAEAADYWHDKCIEYKVSQIWPEKHPDLDYKDLNNLGFWTDRFHGPRGRLNVDYGKVLDKGFNGIIGEIEEQLAKLPLGPAAALRKRETLNAMVIACRAVIALARRYASLTKEMADKETDEARKKELKRISETCQWVPANPARTFREAVQSYWFVHLALQIDHVSAGITPGRLPQYTEKMVCTPYDLPRRHALQ